MNDNNEGTAESHLSMFHETARISKFKNTTPTLQQYVRAHVPYTMSDVCNNDLISSKYSCFISNRKFHVDNEEYVCS